MHQFFVKPQQIGKQQAVIIGNDVRHIGNVLRMHPGEEIQIKSEEGGAVYLCEIESITETEVLCRICDVMEDEQELPCEIVLFQGLPKLDKMELVIQKAVELGVSRIVPVKTARAVMKLDPKKESNKRDRWQNIAEAAAKQSKRGIIPTISPSLSFREAIAQAADMDQRLIPYELAKDMEKTRTRIDAVKPGESVAIFIGPEGGFSEEEISLAMERGFAPITLGKRILRTETAGLTILSWLVYRLEGLK